MVVYFKVSSTNKTDWYNWILYDFSLSITYRRTVVYLKVSSTNKTVPFWLKLASNLQKNSGLSQGFFNLTTDGYNRTLYDLSLSVTYRRMVVYLKVSSTNTTVPLWFMFASNLQKNSGLSQGFFNNKKTDWYNWTFIWLKFVSNLQKNSGLSQGFFNQ